LEQTRAALAAKYANLEWLALERETDLTALFADTKTRISNASNAVDARNAFDRLARKLGDGHVRFRWPGPEDATKTSNGVCTALEYDAQMQGAPVAALMPGFEPLATATPNPFPAGTIQRAGHRIGVLKIGIFTPQGIPELCAAALLALHIPIDAPCDDACADRIQSWGADRMTSDLIAVLGAIKAAGADVLLVDVADNGGGTEWAEAAARMMTGVRLKSERVGFVRGEHWAQAFARQEADLRAAAKNAQGQDRKLLLELADETSARLREARTPCDSAPLWHRETPACRWLGDGFYASGLLDSADPQFLKNKPWAGMLFNPANYPYREALWRGPLIVLVNGGTGSAAEQFTAVLQDNRAAIVMGAPTAGADCGHTDGGTPTTLKNSGGILELPDCARFRRDGSNEVMGIQPDVLVGLREQDGPHRRGLRVAEKLSEAVRRALALNQASP
jgi:hypothetical protein